MRTITADEAIKRVSRFIPSINNLGDELGHLISVRNGVAHLGEASKSDTDAALVAYLKASEELRAPLGIDQAKYWGDFADLVETGLKEQVKKARLKVEAALAVARKEFEKRFGALDETTREAMLHIVEASYAPEKYEEQLLDCPGCNTPALVMGSLTEDYDEDWDHREGVLLGVHLSSVTFTPNFLRCRACDLELDGREELEAAGVEEPWLIDFDEADFYDHDERW